MPFLSRLTIGICVASLAVIGLLFLGLFGGERSQPIDRAYVLQAAGLLVFFSFPYLAVILLARARTASRRRGGTLFGIGTLICAVGVAAFAFDAYSYHTATGDEKLYYQGFVPQFMAAIVQYALLANLTFSTRDPRPHPGGR